jgi:two-component system LytT family response regulator
VKIRTLIADDEVLARDRVRIFLGGETGFELPGECSSGPEAISTLRASVPDLVFLDMQMPGCDGLQVIAELPEDKRPAIVFATAHERFAIEAFDHEAVDYLLKPFDRDRFRQALRRVQDFLQRGRDPGVASDPTAPGTLSPKVDHITVKVDGRLVFIKPEQIVRVEAADNYVWLHLTNERLITRETMTALEARLGTVDFVRVNRSAIVHLNQVEEIKPAQSKDYAVVLRDGTELPLSRSLRGRLKTFIRQPERVVPTQP